MAELLIPYRHHKTGYLASFPISGPKKSVQLKIKGLTCEKANFAKVEVIVGKPFTSNKIEELSTSNLGIEVYSANFDLDRPPLKSILF
jgi:hypothetical protein